MKKIIVQSNLESSKDTFKYIKNGWVQDVLTSIGIDFKDSLNLNEERTIIQRATLKNILKENSINIEDDGEIVDISIFDKDSGSWQKIAFMEKPIYRMRQDLKQKDKNKRLYTEIEIICWSVFDEEE
jgi:hypothetical protein